MIIRFQSTVKEVIARRECFNNYQKREIKRFLLKKVVSFVLGILSLLKYRLIIWSSGDISTGVGVQICSWSDWDRWADTNGTNIKLNS